MKNEAFFDSSTARERLTLGVSMILAPAISCIKMLWHILLLPLVIWRLCIAFGISMLRTIAKILFGLLGLVLLGNFIFGMFYVLAYPWLR